MTKERVCAPGEATSVKALRAYISDVQDQACRLSGVLNAIAFMENEGGHKTGQDALIFIAEELADEVHVALDSINLPEVA